MLVEMVQKERAISETHDVDSIFSGDSVHGSYRRQPSTGNDKCVVMCAAVNSAHPAFARIYEECMDKY
jgi:hypothetical protein